MHVLDPLVVGLQVAHLLDRSAVVLDRIRLLDVADKVLGLYEVLGAGVDVLVLDNVRQLACLGIFLLFGQLHLLRLEELLLVALADGLAVLPVSMLLVSDGVPVDLDVLAVSEHRIQVVLDLTRLQVLAPLARHLALA